MFMRTTVLALCLALVATPAVAQVPSIPPQAQGMSPYCQHAYVYLATPWTQLFTSFCAAKTREGFFSDTQACLANAEAYQAFKTEFHGVSDRMFRECPDLKFPPLPKQPPMQ